ncbi:MAG: thrombospondin type 3 repeat-containing protein [Myxococcales bacterium]|nr:MAG: thrombospondin type 3 repeat-containing protein [Myxococcales bacterium]
MTQRMLAVCKLESHTVRRTTWLFLFTLLAFSCSDSQPSSEYNGDDDAGVDGATDTQRLDAGITPDDSDGDGVINSQDNCPSVANTKQRDRDDDGIGDLCDDDLDGDGLDNAIDVCDDTDSYGEPDYDGDGLRDDCDSCPLQFNIAQKNRDGDNLGDACELDNEATLSRVAYFLSFENGSGDLELTPSARFDQGDSGLEVATPFIAYAWRQEDEDFPDDYMIEAQVVVRAPEWLATRYAVGFIARRQLRTDDDRNDWNGYRMFVDLGEPSLSVESVDGNGCGNLGLLLCSSLLQSTPLTATFPIQSIVTLRVSVIGSELVLSSGDPAEHGAIRVVDDRYSSGGIGLYVEGLSVELKALAVYAP